MAKHDPRMDIKSRFEFDRLHEKMKRMRTRAGRVREYKADEQKRQWKKQYPPGYIRDPVKIQAAQTRQKQLQAQYIREQYLAQKAKKLQQMKNKIYGHNSKWMRTLELGNE